MRITKLLMAAGLLVAPSMAQDDGLLLDGPRGLGLQPALSLAWLLERGASAPPVAWPLPRRDWLAAPPTPTLAWQARARPWQGQADTLRPAGLLSAQIAELRAALDPRLESAAWRLEADPDGRLSEAGNGVEGEALFGDAVGAWMRFRDGGLSGDLDVRRHALFREDEIWLWSQVQPGGELTHDETRAGVVLAGEVGSGGSWSLALLREHLRWGATPGRSAQLQGERAPSVPHLQLRLESGSLSFVQTLGELFSAEPDSLALRPEASGLLKPAWREKWLVAHRLEWRGRDLAISIGEVVLIGDRRPGPGWWIPANFFWSEQHAEQDQDNTLLMADLRWRLPAALPGSWMLSAELAVDDYALAELGQDLEGQKTAGALALDGLPLPVWRHPDGRVGGLALGAWRLPGLSWIGCQQTRARPYFGTHFYAASRYSHGAASLGPFVQPNARATELRWRHEWSPARPLRLAGVRVDPLLLLSAEHLHWVQGQNPADPFVNVGGDLLMPHREGLDGDEAPFLAGRQMTRRGVTLRLEAGLRLESVRGRPLGVLQVRLERQSWRQEEPGVPGRDESLVGAWLAWSRAL
jgi:hypothetical protein